MKTDETRGEGREAIQGVRPGLISSLTMMVVTAGGEETGTGTEIAVAALEAEAAPAATTATDDARSAAEGPPLGAEKVPLLRG